MQVDKVVAWAFGGLKAHVVTIAMSWAAVLGNYQVMDDCPLEIHVVRA